MAMPAIDILGLLADASAKAAVLMTAAGGAAWVLRRAPAVARQLVWTLALSGALVIPALGPWIPRLPIRVPDAVGTVAMVTMAPARAPAPAAPDLSMRARNAEVGTEAGPDGVAHASRTFEWRNVVAVVWLAGAALLFARLIAGLLVVARLARRATAITDPAWLDLARDLACQSRAGRVPALMTIDDHVPASQSGLMPMVAGLRRSVIFLPPAALTWTEERRRAVLLHELGHVRRGDCATQLIAQAACAIYWFHPLVWIAAYRLRFERELACDDDVLEMGTGAADYATHLLAIASGEPRRRLRDTFAAAAGPTIAMARQSQLEGRLQAILDPAPRLRASGTAIAVIAVALIVVVTAVEPRAAQTATVLTPPLRLAPTQAVVVAPPERAQPSQAVPAPTAEPQTRPVVAPPETQPRPVVAPAEGQPARTSSLTPQQRERLTAAFVEALKDSDPDIRQEAVRALAEVGSKEHMEAILSALKDADGDVRQQAAWALGTLGDARAATALLNLLKDEKADVRQQAAWSLGTLSATGAVDALIGTLKDPVADVRQQAAWSLGVIGDARAIEPLTALLKDQSSDVRRTVIWSLGVLAR